MSKLHRRFFLGTMAGSLATVYPRNIRAADAFTLRMSIPTPATTAVGVAALQMASSVRRRSNGQVNIEVFPSGQLIAQNDAVNATISGVIDFMIQSTNFIEALLPRYQVVGLPFLFKSVDAGHKVLDGPIGQGLLAELEPKGIIGYGWTGAMRELWTANKIVANPAEMKGVRVRIPGGALGLEMYQAMGGLPLTIDLSETLSALSQHVIDGIDTITDAFTSSKWYTVAKRANLTNHIFSINMILGSKKKIEALPLPLQKIIKEEGYRTIPFWRTQTAKATSDAMVTLKENGVAFTETDFPSFRKLMDPIYQRLAVKLGGDIVERTTKAVAG